MAQDYRRRLNRAERRKAEKAGDGSGAALREAAEEAEFERAKVRPFAFAMLCRLRTCQQCACSSCCQDCTTMLAANQVPGSICCSCTVHSSMMLPARLPAQSTDFACAAGAADAEAQEHQQVGEAGAAAGHQRHGRGHERGDAGAAAAGDGAAAEGALPLRRLPSSSSNQISFCL